MDRVVTAKIAGEEYPLCLTCRAQQKIAEKYDSSGNFGGGQKFCDTIAEYIRVISILLKGGAEYVSKRDGTEQKEIPSEEDLQTLTPAEVMFVYRKCEEAIKLGSEPTIQLEPGKKGAASTIAQQ
ncbi:hypothetical protein ACVS9P_03670 [Caproicibacterium sp. NSD3]